MSYCRRASGNSDLYVYDHVDGHMVCVDCAFLERGSHTTPTKPEMLEHMQKHKAAGHRVPDYAIDTLRGEIESGDAFEKLLVEATERMAAAKAAKEATDADP